jgi:hypothetical protein
VDIETMKIEDQFFTLFVLNRNHGFFTDYGIR